MRNQSFISPTETNSGGIPQIFRESLTIGVVFDDSLSEHGTFSQVYPRRTVLTYAS